MCGTTGAVCPARARVTQDLPLHYIDLDILYVSVIMYDINV